jgi:hypothetical protein
MAHKNNELNETADDGEGGGRADSRRRQLRC